MASWDKLRDLPLQIDSYSLKGFEQDFGPEFTRYTTVFRLEGGGEAGEGEDVVYDGLDHMSLRERGTEFGLAGEHTLGSFAELLDGLDLFPDPPVREDSRNYRRWAVESAALDLALRQAGRTLGDVLGREPRPVNYVVSMRLGTLRSGGSGDRRPAARRARPLPRHPLQARPHQHLDAGADR